MHMSTDADEVTVLVVDDERDVADLYATWLRDEYEVEVAYGGEDAVDLLGPSLDVVLLDRQMPDLPGDRVLDEIDDCDLDCRVVMVTAVDPDFDIVEMPFDDYLTKPVQRDALFDTVEEMRTRSTYDDQLQRYYALASKKATLETEKSPTELDASEEYTEISERVERLREQADATASEFDDFESVFQEFPGDG
ncbi:MAG: response regulator transcription factor [Haloarculaceae archaeon]